MSGHRDDVVTIDEDVELHDGETQLDHVTGKQDARAVVDRDVQPFQDGGNEHRDECTFISSIAVIPNVVKPNAHELLSFLKEEWPRIVIRIALKLDRGKIHVFDAKGVAWQDERKRGILDDESFEGW